MRVSGLATGMDTEQIIRDMMQAQRIPLDKITQRKQYLEWQLDDYRSTNRNLKSMSDSIFNTVMMESSFMAKNVNISNPDAVGIKAINANSEFSGSISVHQLATQASWQSAGMDGSKGLNGSAEISKVLGEGVTSIEITAPGSDEAVKVDFESGATINSVLDAINKKTGVNAFYDSHTGQIAMTAKNSGVGEIKVETAPGSVVAGSGQAGQNAKFTFNGLTTERTSNTFQINGFEINLKQVTGADAPVTFNSSPDTDKVIETVVKFVDDYNKMIETLNAKIREKKNRDFQPLSAEQKKEMKEKEIEQWEEKAMSGTLRNDPTIQKLLSSMRSALNGGVEGSDGQMIRLSDIGITTSTDWRENGKLIVDETKLRQAITDNPNKVYEVFGKPDEGLAVKLRDAVNEGVKSISARAGNAGDVNDKFTLGSTMKEFDNQILRFQERLKMSEDRLWKQFTAMEMAINRANAQSAQLMSTLGGGM